MECTFAAEFVSKVDADADGEKDETGNAVGLDLICNHLSSSPSNAHSTQ